MRLFWRAFTGASRLIAWVGLVAGLAACSGSPTAPSETGGALAIGTIAQEPTSVPSAVIPNIPPQALGARDFLAFGDSITFGTLSSFDGSFLINDAVGSYPRLLQALFTANNVGGPFTVVNAGQPGETARAGVDRLPGVLNTYRPEVLMLLEGINDMNVFNATPAQTAGNIANMVQTARLFNCTVLVATMPQTYPSTYPDGTTHRQSSDKIVPYNDELRRRLGGQQNVHIVDIYAAFGTDRSLMGADGLHPTSAGYQRMAETFHNRIREIFPVRGSLQ